MYDSTKVSTLRGFATTNDIEVLVINIDSFAKDENIINKPNDKLNGQKPVEFIQATHPIVIVDEPQNMETEKRIAAIENLKALCTLRYSATHRNQYILTYSLNPVKAYDLGLVKQIEVDSIIEENAYNDAFVSVESITATKTKVTAKVSINSNENGGVKKKTITVKVGDDLYKLSNEREIYADGYIIEEIDAVNQCISISNGNLLYKGDSQGGLTDEVMKFQIRKTIEEHLKKEKRLNKLEKKVLSLFFIDKVANYRNYDSTGNAVKGKFAEWFEEIYQEYISGRTKNKQTRTAIKYRKGFEADPKFLEIWEKLKKKTTYRVDYKTDELITLAAKAIKDLPEIKSPSIRSTKIGITMTGEGVGTNYVGEKVESYGGYSWKIPDVLGYIQSKTELTRSTIEEILSKSGRIKDIIINPQLFLDLATIAIKRTLYDLMIDRLTFSSAIELNRLIWVKDN